MRLNILSSTLLALTLLIPAVGQAQDHSYIDGELLVMMRPGVDIGQVALDLASVNDRPTDLRVVKEVSAPMRVWLLHFDATTVPQELMLRALMRHPGVQLAQNNHIVQDRAVPNDTNYGQQWQHQNTDNEAAWDITTGGLTAAGDTIVVCIIENADLPHPDLIDNAWFNHLETPNNSVDDDANGYTDDYEGWNPGGNNDAVYGGGHGTQVAGMIGATGDNSTGVVGVNWDVKMMVVTRDGISEAAVIESYTYPLVMRRLYNQTNGAKGAFVVSTNASWGIDNADPTDYPLWCAMYDTLGTAGILSCGATANNNVDIDAVGDMPTGCTSDFLVSVTATNDQDNRTFSAYGAQSVDIGAPGSDVHTTTLGGGYGNTSGTSFASPFTAGVIALLYSAPCSSLMDLVQADPSAGALYIRDKLFEGVEQVGNLPGTITTGGRVNTFNSLQLIMSGCGACPVPYNLGAATPTIGSADLSWSSSASTTFNVQYQPIGGAWTTVNGVSGTNLTINALDVCTEYAFQVEADCDTIASGWSGSFLFTTEGCCTAPATITITNITADAGEAQWSTVLAGTDYSLQYRPVGSGTWNVVNGLVGNTYEITGLTACTTYEVQVQTDCNGTPADWSTSAVFTTIGCGACQDSEYCPSVSADASTEWIGGVTLNTLNNISGSNDGYGDFTSLSTDLVIGQSYTITLEPDYPAFNFQEYFQVWIDLDQNGAFDDIAELVVDPGSAVSNSITGILVVPATATVGNTRMRVIMKYETAAGSACTDGYDYGETEDYCVNLVEPNGIVEPTAADPVRVSPNPADQQLSFDILAPGADDVRIVLLDNTGRTVSTELVRAGRATFTTAPLSPGLYHYRVLANGAELHRGKVMVAH